MLSTMTKGEKMAVTELSNIPEWGDDGVLPQGEFSKEFNSPYICSMEEFHSRFGVTEHRKVLLEGLIKYREILRNRLSPIPDLYAIQWIDGSFIQNIEIRKAQSK